MRAEDWETGQVVAEMRRFLSCAIVRAQGLCLLNRICNLGERGRREAAKRVEEARR